MVLLDGGKVQRLTFKYELPNYGVFDEKRVFAPGPAPGPLTVRGVRLGVPICEDIWKQDVTVWLAERARRSCCVPNGSPFEAGKEDVRLTLAAARVRETGLPLIYLNQLGGQDELVFDGASFVLNADRHRGGAAGLAAKPSLSPNGRATRTANGSCAPGDTVPAEEPRKRQSITP